jgi:hypothetical protein
MEDYVEIEVSEEMMCACYVLMMDDQAIYVGQSKNIFNRLGSHLSNNAFRVKDKIGFTDFNRIRIYYCERKRLTWLEDELIAKYRPPRNLYGVGGMWPTKEMVDEIIARKVVRRMT